MCFFECPPVLQVGSLLRYLQIQPCSQQVPSLQIWIIFFGEFTRRSMIISLYGSYGIFGKDGITKSLAILTLIPHIRSNWQKHNLHFRLRHIYWAHRGQYLIYRDTICILNIRKMVFYRWFLERDWYFLSTRLVQYTGFWWVDRGKKC